MLDLLEQYKKTLIQTRADARACEKVGNKNDELLYRAAERDLQYSIEWLSTGNEPLMYALERQSHEKRKVHFDFNAVEGSLVIDPMYIQVNVENVMQDTTEEELESCEAKTVLVDAIKLSLTPRQIEVLELVAAGYTHEEAAELLGITRSAVSKSIDSSRARIKKDGWVMMV